MKNKLLLVFCVLIAFILLMGCSKSPNEEQIKTDLIGQVISSGGLYDWKFESIAEFKDVKIINKKQQGDIIEYNTNLRIKDTNTNEEYLVELLIVYKKENGVFKIVSTSTKSFKRVEA